MKRVVKVLAVVGALAVPPAAGPFVGEHLLANKHAERDILTGQVHTVVDKDVGAIVGETLGQATDLLLLAGLTGFAIGKAVERREGREVS